jgi:uncharacterized protein YdaT
MCFFRKRREKKLALAEEQKALANKNNEEQTPIVNLEPKEVKVEVLSQEVEKENKKIEEPKKEKTEPKVVKPQKYHVSQNKDEDSENFKKWRVRKEGSTKTIKFFDTQKEAIEFAEGLADNQGSSVVIHKLDGSIRKQDYTKK